MKLWKGIRAIQYIDKCTLKNKKIDIKDTIVIAGAPRSGTTWVMELLRNLPQYTFLFEPLNPSRFPECFEVGFKSRTYLPDHIDWPEGKNYLRKTLTGKVFSLQNPYTFKPKMVMHSLLATKLIVKYVRLNRLLTWTVKKFKLNNVFYVIRHPCSVVASQLKTGWCGYHPSAPPYINIFPNLENILDEASEIEELDHELLNRLKNLETREEILAAAWCLDNYVPLSLPKPHSWTTVVYEKLIKENEKETARLLCEIEKRNVSQSITENLKKPSMLTLVNDREIVKNVDLQLSKWKKTLSSKQIHRILKVVSDFGLDFYTEDLEPDYENIGVNCLN